MTERERWVVYPLLFLALGAALRDKLFDRTITKSIWCQELTVVDDEPADGQSPGVIARIGRAGATRSASTSGYLIVNGQVDVNGLVNAKQYAYNGQVFVPALQAIFPWSSDFLRALRPSVRRPQQRPSKEDSSVPSANGDQSPASSSAREGDSAQAGAPRETGGGADGTQPLAEPSETR